MVHDSEQLAAVAVSSNAVVSAGAGSGKTSVLSARYLRLVIEDRLRVGEILTLTFTRKAAAEMYERIYRSLLARSADPFVREQLASFDDAVIATLDSFCAAVARNGCTRFGVPPTFAIDEDALANRCEELALAFLTEHAGRPVVADLIRLNRFGPLWKDGLARLAVEHFRVSDERPLTDYLPGQRVFLDAELLRIGDEIRRAAAGIAGLDPNGARCIRDACEIVSSVDLDHALREVPEQLTAFTRIKLSCGASKHPDVSLLKECVQELRDLVDRYLLACRTRDRWESHAELMVLLDEFRERVVLEKQRTGLLSYQDVTGLAIRTLIEDDRLRAYYKRRFRAVMIDEFQDNNEEQKFLLYLISERLDRSARGVPGAQDLQPGKLFFVGDEKQSIYRFRGADVSVFRTLADDLSGPDAELRLGANYRSEPGLIRFYNELFRRVFADAARDYEARFETLRSRPPTPGVVPRVELWHLEQRPASDESFLDDADAEAFHLATFIRDTVEDKSLLVGAGVDDAGARCPGRPATYDDFAILMRSSSNQIRLERMLRIFGVPYVSQSARSLFLEAPVNDIYQVLQLVLYPEDRLAGAGYLRSPLVGLSDEGLVRQLLAEAPLLVACDGHTVDDRRRLANARDRYDELCRLADSRPITELLHHIWYRWGYRYHLLRRREHTPYLEYYDLFWELAHRYEERGLAAFLDEVRRHIGRNEKLSELETVRSETAGVQIMTIHRSKGLEFPVVIVANAGNRGRNETVSACPYYWSPARGLAFNTGLLPDGAVREKPANYLYTYELDEHRAQELAEMKRLLYVAATRAESHLFFSGVPRDTDRSLSGILAPAFSAALVALAGADAQDVNGPLMAERVLEPVRTEQESRAHRAGGRRDIAALAEAYASTQVVNRSYPPAEVTVSALNEAPAGILVPSDAGAKRSTAGRLESPEHPIDAVLAAHDLAAVFGSYCHYCIEHAGELEGAVPPVERLPRALRPDIPPRKLELFLSSGLELARAYLSSPLAAELERAERIERELAFLLDARELGRELGRQPGEGFASSGPSIIRGQIDLVAEYVDHVLVLDFKTDRVLDPESYEVQLAVYRAAAEAMYGKPARSMLVHLRSGTAVPLG